MLNSVTLEQYIAKHLPIYPFSLAKKHCFINSDDNTVIYPLAKIKSFECTSGILNQHFTKETINRSKQHKANKYKYCNLSINGLHQPTKSVPIATYKALNLLCKRFDSSSIDIAIDGYIAKDISQDEVYSYVMSKLRGQKHLIKDIIKQSKRYKGTIYINPTFTNQEAKINNPSFKIYHKGYKQYAKQGYNDDNIGKWLRIEATININKRFSDIDFLFDDVLGQQLDYIKAIAYHLFDNYQEIRTDLLTTQLRAISDYRSLSKANSRYKEILKLNDSHIKGLKEPLKKPPSLNKKPIQPTHNIKLYIDKPYHNRPINRADTNRQKIPLFKPTSPFTTKWINIYTLPPYFYPLPLSTYVICYIIYYIIANNTHIFKYWLLRYHYDIYLGTIKVLPTANRHPMPHI